MENFLEAEQPAFGDTDLIQAQIAQSDVSSDHLTSQFKFHVYSCMYYMYVYNAVRSALHRQSNEIHWSVTMSAVHPFIAFKYYSAFVKICISH